MKKLLALILAIIMMLTLAACSGGDDASDEDATQDVQQEQTQDDAAVVEDEASEEEPPVADTTGTPDVNNDDWDATLDEAFRSQLPKPEVSLFVNQITDGYKATFWGADEAYMREYVEALKSAGFTIDAADSSNDVTNAVVWYEASNEAGYRVIVNLGDNGGGAIDILKYE